MEGANPDAGAGTHHSDVIEQAILDERVGQAGVVASPVLRVALADLTEYPRKVHAGAAAREENL